jgi:NADPH:quinone reductase
MPNQANRQIILVSRPTGLPSLSNFQLISRPIPSPKEGEALVQTLYLSVDPYMRSRMNDRPSYIEPFQLNHPLTGGVVGKVLQSNTSTFQPGDYVLGFSDWADYFVASAKELEKIDLPEKLLSASLGILGMPGMTAYFGLLDVGKPQAGETLVVTAAAGAVGSIVGQIGKIKGCYVVGIAGNDEKIRYLTQELHFDVAINYKRPDFLEKLAEATSKGVDIYFDNVGGVITDAIIARINDHARIVICGQISMYNLEKEDIGLRPFPRLLVKNALAKGFMVYEYGGRFPEGRSQIAKWLQEGVLKYHESIVQGLENAPRAFLGLFSGENRGKQLVKIS